MEKVGYNSAYEDTANYQSSQRRHCIGGGIGYLPDFNAALGAQLSLKSGATAFFVGAAVCARRYCNQGSLSWAAAAACTGCAYFGGVFSDTAYHVSSARTAVAHRHYRYGSAGGFGVVLFLAYVASLMPTCAKPSKRYTHEIGKGRCIFYTLLFFVMYWYNNNRYER